MSWLCLVCECIHALCLSNFARPCFPSFFGWSCWFVAQLNPIAQQTAEWRSCRPCLHLRTNLGPRIAFWGPDLGHILVPVSGSIFGHRFGPLQLQTKSRPQNRAQKWNPKQGPKYDPNQDPKMQSGAPNLYGDANKLYMIFIQRSAWRSYSIVQQTNNFNQRRKGNLGEQNCSNREHEYIRRPNIVKTCFTCRRYQSSLTHGKINSMLATMGVRPCVTANCLFWGPGFGTSFCSILRPLLATLLHPWVAQFAASILSLEDAKCEIASLSNTCGLHMFKQWSNNGAIYWAGQWNRGTKFRYGGILRIVAKMLASPVPLLSNVDL